MAYRSALNSARIASILAAHGPIKFREPVPAEVIALYEGRVPDLILDFWENEGIGELGGGLMRLCIPEMFAEPLQVLFEGDPDFGTGTLALAYGPFGSLVLWNQKEWLALLTHPSATVDAPFFQKSKAGLDRDQMVLEYFLDADPRMMDIFDDGGVEMYDNAVRALGPLKPGLIFGLMPPDSFETVAIENLQVVVAQDWLIERFSGHVYQIHDLTGDRLNIRKVGEAQ